MSKVILAFTFLIKFGVARLGEGSEGRVVEVPFVTPNIALIVEVLVKPMVLVSIPSIRILLLSETSLLIPMCHIQYFGNMTAAVF